ncbi:hypothetical protein AVEN_16532-1 [Araneus ventricosus]|uniref:Uncharacterized protein n=1 Tax=Araneus ventricosus TaxID=182803 RepID=A0A4Y2N9Q2_ARAVE|nr:hypothetical protein AVEN_16532-1 [Araneus ventricosus]
MTGERGQASNFSPEEVSMVVTRGITRSCNESLPLSNAGDVITGHFLQWPPPERRLLRKRDARWAQRKRGAGNSDVDRPPSINVFGIDSPILPPSSSQSS